MTWTRYFRLSSYGVIVSGFAAIAVTGAVDLFSLSLFGSAIAVSWFIDTEALKRRLPSWALNSLVAAYLFCYLADYLIVSRSFVISTIHLAFYVAALKILTLTSDSDYVYLYCISFAELLAASTLTVDITFIVSLLIFLISSVSTLILFEMRRTHGKVVKEGRLRPFVTSNDHGREGVELFTSFPAWSMIGITLSMTLLIIVVAIPLFLLLPRVALGIYSRPPGKSRLTSGFSERVELGQIGTIKESDAVVMKVRVSEPAAALPGSLKWRGIALAYYDGRSWSRSWAGRARITPERDYFRLERSIQGTRLLEQTYFLEALTTDVVFASHKALAISSDLGFLQRDASGSLFSVRHDTQKVRYRAVSDITPPDPRLIPPRSPEIPEAIRSTYLQLPHLDRRIAELAREVTNAQGSPYQKALALERYLRSSYDYSLELKGSPNSPDPLAMFLFDVRRGHCEYFASAMAIMLRQIGIPARLVNGFRAGEYNRLADAFVVHQYNAHSWVEAYFPPYGWLEFDPTPPDPTQLRSGFARLVETLVDAVSLWWWEDVINYDVWKQFRFIAATRSTANRLQHRMHDWLRAEYARLRAAGERHYRDRMMPGLAAALIGLAAILALSIYIRMGRGRRGLSRLRHSFYRIVFPGEQNRIITICYREALDVLHSWGFCRAPGLTPLEFAHSLRGYPAGAPFEELTHLYNRVRFGASWSAEDLTQAEGLLKSLRSSSPQRHNGREHSAPVR